MIKLFFKEYGIWYLLTLLVNTLFLFIFYLYRLPLDNFVYASLLTCFIYAMFSLILFFKFKHKLDNLHNFIYVKSDNAFEQLTLPSDLAYQEIINQFNDNLAKEKLEKHQEEQRLHKMIKMWSHQMKIPLASLSLMAQTEHLQKIEIQEQVLRLDKDLARLLNYMKFRDNQSDYRFEQCSMRNIIVTLIKENQILCRQKNLSINVSGDWSLKSDKKWLTFALGQILDNAIKYSNTNSKINVSINDKELLITDFGIGILTEDLPRIFEEGFTGLNGHHHQKATGLGLHMTKDILSHLNLGISVDSQIDQGTTVSVYKL